MGARVHEPEMGVPSVLPPESSLLKDPLQHLLPVLAPPTNRRAHNRVREPTVPAPRRMVNLDQASVVIAPPTGPAFEVTCNLIPVVPASLLIPNLRRIYTRIEGNCGAGGKIVHHCRTIKVIQLHVWINQFLMRHCASYFRSRRRTCFALSLRYRSS